MIAGSNESGSFATEFERYVAANPGELKAGSIINGKIVEIGEDYVAVDVNFKSYGLVPLEEFKDSDGKVAFKVGDQVEVCVLSIENDENELVLSRERAHQRRVWGQVEELFENGGTISGKVVQKVKGGLQVDIGIPAFLPGSQVDVRPHRNLDKFLGETYDFKVLKLTRDKGNIVLSRRAVLVSERDQLRSETLKVLSEGVVLEGIVKNVTDYGAFIDLGGIDGLLHITDISWGRVNHPSDRLSVGQAVPVVVLKYDTEKERVSLGMKQLKEDPWVKASEKYAANQIVKGKVVNLADYGVYLELEDGVEGLVHVDNISWTKNVRRPNKMFAVGDSVEAMVIGLDQEQRRLDLGIKQLLPNPWTTLHTRIPVGSKISGKVRAVKDFGIFVEVEDGIDGLVHATDMSWTNSKPEPKDIQDMFKKGQDVEALVLDIDVKNERLSLGIKQLESDPWDTLAQRFPVGTKISGKIASFSEPGVFVEVEPGIRGLLRVSEFDLEKGQTPQDLHKVGDTIECTINSIDRETRRIALGLKAKRGKEDRDSMASDFNDSGRVTFADILRDKIGGEDR